MISHIMLTFSCDKCGAEKQRPASEDDKTPPLPYGWVSFDSAEDSRKRHKCLECCARDGYAAAEEVNTATALKDAVFEPVMEWLEAHSAEDEEGAQECRDRIFLAVAAHILGEKAFSELRRKGKLVP